MFLHKDKEYYPLEIAEIICKGKVEVYNRSKRNKSYAYIAVIGTQEKENEA